MRSSTKALGDLRILIGADMAALRRWLWDPFLELTRPDKDLIPLSSAGSDLRALTAGDEVFV